MMFKPFLAPAVASSLVPDASPEFWSVLRDWMVGSAAVRVYENVPNLTKKHCCSPKSSTFSEDSAKEVYFEKKHFKKENCIFKNLHIRYLTL